MPFGISSMGPRNKEKRRKLLKLIPLVLVVILIALYIFQDEIKEHKVTKAKMEMLKRMYTSPPDEWDDEFIEVLDSMILEKKDSLQSAM